MKCNSLALLFFTCFFVGVIISGCGFKTEESQPETLVIKKCEDFRITGDGSSPEWGNSKWIDLQKQGKVISPYYTKVKVLYSETGIYFLFDCEDTRLSATMMADNLNLWEEDVVEIFLWPDESFPVYFEYELSPLNYELPIIIPNKNGTFLGWLPWNYDGDKRTIHATSVTGGQKESGSTITGWKAEFFIPYKLLAPLVQEAPAPGTRWRANMYRIDYDNGAGHFAWQKTEGSFHQYDKFGAFIFE